MTHASSRRWRQTTYQILCGLGISVSILVAQSHVAAGSNRPHTLMKSSDISLAAHRLVEVPFRGDYALGQRLSLLKVRRTALPALVADPRESVPERTKMPGFGPDAQSTEQRAALHDAAKKNDRWRLLRPVVNIVDSQRRFLTRMITAQAIRLGALYFVGLSALEALGRRWDVGTLANLGLLSSTFVADRLIVERGRQRQLESTWEAFNPYVRDLNEILFSAPQRLVDAIIEELDQENSSDRQIHLAAFQADLVAMVGQLEHQDDGLNQRINRLLSRLAKEIDLRDIGLAIDKTADPLSSELAEHMTAFRDVSYILTSMVDQSLRISADYIFSRVEDWLMDPERVSRHAKLEDVEALRRLDPAQVQLVLREADLLDGDRPSLATLIHLDDQELRQLADDRLLRGLVASTADLIATYRDGDETVVAAIDRAAEGTTHQADEHRQATVEQAAEALERDHTPLYLSSVASLVQHLAEVDAPVDSPQHLLAFIEELTAKAQRVDPLALHALRLLNDQTEHAVEAVLNLSSETIDDLFSLSQIEFKQVLRGAVSGVRAAFELEQKEQGTVSSFSHLENRVRGWPNHR